MIFEVKKEHLILLQNAYISWDSCEFGAPGIDPKRPYGNSYVLGDIAELLNISFNEDEEFNDKDYSYMNSLHKEIEIVLQIVLKNITESNYIGIWEAENYSRNWKKVK